MNKKLGASQEQQGESCDKGPNLDQNVLQIASRIDGAVSKNVYTVWRCMI